MYPAGEESITLSSFDFNSSFGLCSSCDDEDNDYANHKMLLDQGNKDDTDAYFDLELRQAAPAATPPLSLPSQLVGGEDDDDDKELEFRFSFSAVVPFPGFLPSSINSANVNLSSKGSSCGTGEDPNAQQSTAAVNSWPRPVVGSTLSCIHLQRPISTDSMLIPPLARTRFPQPVEDDYTDHGCQVSDMINSWGLVRSCRKESSKIKSGANGRIMKLLVKLRCIVISGLGSMRAPLAQGMTSSQAQKRCPNSRGISLMKPLDQWCMQQQQQQMTYVETTAGRGGSSRSSSKILEMKFEGMRKLFGSAVSPLKQTNNNSGSKTCRLNKSGPTSNKSSPLHQSGDHASLVHAAIAHCKKSFAQNHDFSF